MSVIFRFDGLDAVLTFLISGSACARFPIVPPARRASDDLRTRRRFRRSAFPFGISVHSSRARFVAPSYFSAAVSTQFALSQMGEAEVPLRVSFAGRLESACGRIRSRGSMTFGEGVP